MELWQAIVLGIIQGLTEFLPVSSSGHLVIGQSLFGLDHPPLAFDVSLHVGTLMAVIIFFRHDIWGMIISSARCVGRLFSGQSQPYPQEDQDRSNIRWAGLIILGSVPTAAIGLVLNNFADTLFSSTVLVGWMLLVTATLLWATRHKTNCQIDGCQPTAGRAMLIGILQGLAIFPGISRSGITISGGIFSGMDRTTSARFSFLLSIPAIMGAAGLQLFEDQTTQLPAAVFLAGTLISGFVGYLALRWLLLLVDKGRLHLFAPYCCLAGSILLLMAWVQ